MRTVVLATILAGCVPPANQPYNGTQQVQPAQPAVQQGNLGCVDVMQCYGACPGLAADCTSRCDATGTSEASAANTELFRCIAANQCADESCITTQCAASLQTCVSTAGVAVQQQPTQPGQPTQPAQPAQPAEGQHLPAVPDSEFVFVGKNGLEYVPDLTVAAQGVPVTLDGLWADTKHNFSIELRGNTYLTTFAQSSAYFQAGTTTTEAGTWSLAGTTFTMTPATTHLGATRLNHQESENQRNDPPRTWTLVGATLAYVKFGDASGAVHQVDGLVLSGTVPSWDPIGSFAHTVRRAR